MFATINGATRGLALATNNLSRGTHMAASNKDDPFGEPTLFDPEQSVRLAKGHEVPSKSVVQHQFRTTMDVAPPPPSRPEADITPTSRQPLGADWAPLYLDDDVVGSHSVNLKLVEQDLADLHTPIAPAAAMPAHPPADPPAEGSPPANTSKPAPIRVKRVGSVARPPTAAPHPASARPRSTSRSDGSERFPAQPSGSQVIASTAADPKLIEGSRIGNYEVIRKIGQGGMGVVYEGRHLLLPRRVAIKFLLTNQSHDEEQIRRFLGEAVASAQIGHKGVVDIYDYGYDDNKTAYLIMEFVDGQSLQAIMKRSGQLPIPMVVRVVRDIADVLAAAHQSGIIHRDLKPDNIILARDEFGKDFVKILDFGVAKFVNAQGMSGQTAAGSILGTPWYMPPEQCQGLREVNFRSDIYALGCVCYQMLCGKVPFAGSLRDVLTSHIHSEPTPPTQFNPSVPPSLESLILRMMAKDPKHRPGSMDEVAQVLQGLAEPEARTHAQIAPPLTPQAIGSASPWVVPAITALVACIGTAAAFYFLQG
tara:strand:- start:156067 stop:157671 length:1605 start_codon:yes stop_codon:yes gene_type:complete